MLDNAMVLDIKSDRDHDRYDFVMCAGGKSPRITFLASDMSQRSYWRVVDQNNVYVLMDAPPPECIDTFIDVTRALQAVGVRAPKIFHIDYDRGFLLLEDFGDATFTKIIKHKILDLTESFLYDKAIDVLIHLHQKHVSKPGNMPDYSVEKLLIETDIFSDYYWMYKFKVPMPSDLRRALRYEFQKKFNDVLDLTPKTIVLRDYHVDNLMILSDGSCGVLDYQDALFGPVTYDIVSLTEDARMTVSPELEAHVWNRYLEHIPKSKHEAYRHQGDILSAGRHAKILGVFARYDLKYNNASKLCYLDYVEKLLMRSLERSGANEIIHLLKDIT